MKKAQNLDHIRLRRTKSPSVDEVRHSLSHLLAAAVLKEFPKAKLGIGPIIENGFYYDFKLPRPLAPEDLKTLEKTMRQLIEQHLPFSGKKLTAAEAKKMFKDQPFKLELIKELAKAKQPISIYITGNKPKTTNYSSFDPELRTEGLPTTNCFIDLCRGGHVKNTEEIPADAFKLTHLAGAYWKGSEKNQMLTRIYGLAFATKKELDAHLALVEEAKKRDHKLLGRELRLFTFSPLVGPGLPLYFPNGTTLREAILNYITELKRARNYQFVCTPHLAREDLYKKSGHFGKYDAMLPPLVTEEGERLIVKPMNCPHHFQIYNAEPHSYRDLPYRIAENATDYRNEKSGELNGLLRVRSLTQDDTHHMVRRSEITSEIDMILKLIEEVYKTFGFKDFRARISTRDPKNADKYFGTKKLWDDAEGALIAAAKRWGIEHFIGEGEAAFYGPKIDVLVKDALGREWQLSTVQLDYVQPENFDMTYANEDGKSERPAVLHVAILGSLDRFLGIIIEHYAGAFPAWLSPVQAAVLPVGEKYAAYAERVAGELKSQHVRIEMSAANETLGKRIRDAELKKIPYILVVGEKEESAGTVNVRTRHKKETETKPVRAFIETLLGEIAAKK
ncbi:MAG: threonine--tRNA ligase [Candidatus Jorgensenbacteria bacterium]